jgi:hypothetical protein
MIDMSIRVITKLPNSEQSYKGKVKTHNYINRQNQSTTGKLCIHLKLNDNSLRGELLSRISMNFEALLVSVGLAMQGNDY